jgi:prevent-host-death family protein
MDARASEFGSADAKARFSELLARVEAGETITIRRHGKVVARMVPVKPEKTPEERRKGIEDFLKWRKEHGPRLQPGDNVKDWINEGRP